MPFVILPVPTEITPEFDKITSPEIACATAVFDPFPIHTLPSVSAVPAGFVAETAWVAMDVIRPLASTEITGIARALPKSPATTPLFANVAEIAPVPEPVTSPLNVMVWSPVFEPMMDASLATVSVFEIVPPTKLKPVPKLPGRTPLMDLLLKSSDPANVLKVPEIGKFKDVAAETVKLVANAPFTTKFPPSVTVFPELSTPVPPLAADKIPDILASVTAPSAIFNVLMAFAAMLGLVAVPVISPNNLILPATVDEASGVPPVLTVLST